MQSWAEEELRYTDLGDARLNRRLIQLVSDFSSKPSVSIPHACNTWPKIKAAYRFFSSPRILPYTIIDSHIKSTLDRIYRYMIPDKLTNRLNRIINNRINRIIRSIKANNNKNRQNRQNRINRINTTLNGNISSNNLITNSFTNPSTNSFHPKQTNTNLGLNNNNNSNSKNKTKGKEKRKKSKKKNNNVKNNNKHEKKRILIIQDTTNLDFTHHPSTRGIGYLDNPRQIGLKVHSALAVTGEGVPLGLLHQDVWIRDFAEMGKKHTRRKRDITKKESYRWLNTLSITEHLILERIKDIIPNEYNKNESKEEKINNIETISNPHIDIELITIADREADIYDLLAMPRREDIHHILIRAAHNRRVNHKERYLWPAISKSDIKGEMVVEIGRRGARPSRKAVLSIRYETLEIYPPRYRQPNLNPKSKSKDKDKGKNKDKDKENKNKDKNDNSSSLLKPVSVQVILAQEKNPPSGIKPISWLLITTHPIHTLEDAKLCIRWYSYRWLIERYHFVLKSGCHIEELQLKEVDRIKNALSVYAIVAWRILWLTYKARIDPNAPCNEVLEEDEWKILYSVIHNTTILPNKPPPVKDVILWIAKLGGFIGRRHDGQPGVKTIWRGFSHFNDIIYTWNILKEQIERDMGNG